MKLRIARKMDQKQRKHDDKRPWWYVYSVDQLKRAEMRLQRAWMTACPIHILSDGRPGRSITNDFYRMNRVRSRRVRLVVLRRDYGNKYR